MVYGDSNTDGHRFVTAGGNRLFITGSTGNITIGGDINDIPKRLTVEGSISASGDFMIHTPPASTRGIHWNSGSGNKDVSIRSTGGGIYVGSGSVNRHILHQVNSGNVGINTLETPKP